MDRRMLTAKGRGLLAAIGLLAALTTFSPARTAAEVQSLIVTDAPPAAKHLGGSQGKLHFTYPCAIVDAQGHPYRHKEKGSWRRKLAIHRPNQVALSPKQ